MAWRWLATGTLALSEFAITWLAQSTAILAIGLLAGWLLRRNGPAVQSTLLRTTLVGVLLVPSMSALVGAAGFDHLAIRLQIPVDAAPLLAGDVDRATIPAALRATVEREDPSASFGDRSGQPSGLPRSLGNPGWPPDAWYASETADGPSAMANRQIDPMRLPVWIVAGSGVVLMTWLLGTILLTVRLWIGCRRAAVGLATSVPAGAEVDALCQELARRMGLDPPSARSSPFLSSPCLVGIRRPAILLPGDTREGLRDALGHELAHLARRDGHWNLLRLAAEAALWPQPLIWILSRRLESAAEEICDDVVIQLGADRARYASHLLDLAERMVPPRIPMGIGMIAPRSLLAARIVRILDTSRSLSTRAGRRHVVGILLLGIVGTLLSGRMGVGIVVTGIRAAEADQEAEPPTNVSRAIDEGRVDRPEMETDPDRQAVTRALQDGARYLRSRQQTDGSWPDDPATFIPTGTSALAILALLAAGDPATEPHVARGLVYLRRFDTEAIDTTYGVALQTMAFASGDPERDRDRIAGNVAWLERAQIREDDQVEGDGSWTYTSKKSSIGDNSNSYYALLALDAARNAGLKVDPKVWASSRGYWETAQRVDGSWAYRSTDSGRSTASMTCAGIAALAIFGQERNRDRGVLAGGEDPRAADPNLRRGIQWISDRFNVRENVGMGATWKFYYLASLERAARLTGLRSFGDHDWYREGASELIRDQDRVTGTWRGTGIERDTQIATSFALLFLGRGRAPIPIDPP